jgi:hypothetical protein
MHHAILIAVVISSLVAGRPAFAQQDPVLGNWRGTLKAADGTSSPVIITVVKTGDSYGGSTTGVGESSESPLTRVSVAGTRVTLEGSAESKLGSVTLGAELTVDGNAMRGAGTLGVGNQKIPVNFELQRRARQDVVQHHVEQRAEYFAGRWTFEYLGGEFPPLSTGDRAGSVTFSAMSPSQFLTGVVEGESLGKPFKETVMLGVNPDTKMVVLHERRADGVEIVSLGNWTSPLAIVFQTAPVQSGGRSYQLRRVISLLSESAFDVTEEFSVNGGAFRKLGTARYTKQ